MKRITFFILFITLISTMAVFSADLNELVGGSMSLLCTGQFYRNMIYWPQEAVTFQKEMLPSYGLDIGTKMQWTDQAGTAHDVKVFEVIQNSFYPVSDNNQPICEQFERRLRYPLPRRIVNGVDMTVLRHTDDPVDAATPSDMVIYHHCTSDVGIDIERWAYSFDNEQFDDAIVFEFVFTNVSSQPRQDVYFGFRAKPGARLSGGLVWSNYYGAQYRDGTDSLRIYYNCDAATYLGSQGRAPDDRAEPDSYWGNFRQPQYLGYLILHADKSSDDETDDPTAPHKEGWADYRHIPNIEGDSHEQVYQFLSLPWDENITHIYTAQDGMIRLRKPGRNKRDINPQIESTKNALLSFGPYQMNPGDDVRIVLAFVGGSISERLAIDAGEAYDSGYQFSVPRTPMPYAIPSLGIEAGQLLTMGQIDTLLDTGLDSLLRHAGRLVRAWDNSDIKNGAGSFVAEMAPPSPSIEIEGRMTFS
ncbi:MAG: hypothetical protein GWP06_09855 [Actinobacteria bacterium]|nr:hypothetical protein [Actinomycetota bacterium]